MNPWIQFYVHNAAFLLHQGILIYIYWHTRKIFYPPEEVRWVYFNATENDHA